MQTRLVNAHSQLTETVYSRLDGSGQKNTLEVMVKSINKPRPAASAKRTARGRAVELGSLGRIYNVCAYQGQERVMKETLTATSKAEARAIGRIVLDARGLKGRGIRLMVVPVSADALGQVIASPL